MKKYDKRKKSKSGIFYCIRFRALRIFWDKKNWSILERAKSDGRSLGQALRLWLTLRQPAMQTFTYLIYPRTHAYMTVKDTTVNV